MPEEIGKLYKEWAAAQLISETPIEKPQKLKDYLEERNRIIEKAAENGCMIG